VVEAFGHKLETHHPVIEPVSAAEPGTEICDAEPSLELQALNVGAFVRFSYSGRTYEGSATAFTDLYDVISAEPCCTWDVLMLDSSRS
jgi:hypothetical protein